MQRLLQPNCCYMCNKTDIDSKMTACKHVHKSCLMNNKFFNMNVPHRCLVCHNVKITFKQTKQLFFEHMLEHIFKISKKVMPLESCLQFIEKECTDLQYVDQELDCFWIRGEPTHKKLSCLVVIAKLCKMINHSIDFLYPDLKYCYQHLYFKLQQQQQQEQSLSSESQQADKSSIEPNYEPTNQVNESTNIPDINSSIPVDTQVKYIEMLMDQASKGLITYQEANKLMLLSCNDLTSKTISQS